LLISSLFGKRSIQTVHGIYRNENATIPRESIGIGHRVRFALKNALESFYLTRIRNLIAITRQIEEMVVRDAKSSVRVFRINNAIDASFFSDTAVRTRGDRINLLFVAAITPRKGLHVLIGAFRELLQEFPNLHLKVVGTWDWAPEYVSEQRVACADLERDGAVEFTGSVSTEQILMEFRSADIFVLPSLSESAPMVIAQAMAAGLPIVATKVGGIPEMIDDNVNGLLVPANSQDALYQVLARLIRSSELRERLGAKAREMADMRYNPLSVATATRKAYLDTITSQRR
jgi:glycosyltransferase involved in cell wall biosynthesis